MVCFAGVSSTEVGSSMRLRRMRMRKRKVLYDGEIKRRKRGECLGA